MRLGAMRRMFIELAGAKPRGWDEIWPAFVAFIREPVEEPSILCDNVWVEIVARGHRLLDVSRHGFEDHHDHRSRAVVV
jgi:hypothetical protein